MLNFAYKEIKKNSETYFFHLISDVYQLHKSDCSHFYKCFQNRTKIASLTKYYNNVFRQFEKNVDFIN